MTTSAAAARDVLAVTMGAGGVRARRTGLPDAADSFVEVPGAPIVPGSRADAARLVATIVTLTARDGRPPEAAVWAVPAGWSGGPAGHLVTAVSAAVGGARVAVIAESYAVHAGALSGVHPGACLNVGISAEVLATDCSQTWRTLDNWGHVLGSRGSGSWIGAQALAAGLRARDGVPDGSAALLEAGRRAFGPESDWAALIAAADAATALTTFAPDVCALTHEDPHARAIIVAASDHLAELLAAGLRWVPGAPIVAVGGLLYLDALRVALASALGRRRMILVPGLGGALEGARLVGEHLLRGGALPHHPPYVLLDTRRELTS